MAALRHARRGAAGAAATIEATPASRKSQRISDSVHAVATARTAKITNIATNSIPITEKPSGRKSNENATSSSDVLIDDQMARKRRRTFSSTGNTLNLAIGANAVLVETAGSIGAALHAGEGFMVVGLDITCTHHRGAREGIVTAVAEPLSLGRTVTSYEVRVTDDQDRPLCTGRLTCLIRPVIGT